MEFKSLQNMGMVRTIKVSTEIDYPPNYDWQHKTKDEIISDNPKMIETKSTTYTWDCPINLHIETMTNATKDDNCISDSGWDYVFGLTSPKIKGESFADDFYVQGLGDMSPIGGKGSDDYFDALYDMSEDQNKEIPFELCGGRDGLYETNYVQFAIFSKDEVEEIIRELQTALKKGYSV